MTPPTTKALGAIVRRPAIPVNGATVFGWTSTGKHLAVTFEVVDEELPQVYVVTAFEARPPAEPKRRRNKR